MSLKIKTPPGPRAAPVLDRIQSKVAHSPSGCWEWTGAVDLHGYGYLTIGSRLDGTRRKAKAHRVAYEALVGPVPEGLDLDHLCRNRGCVNPEHLEPVTRRENLRRGLGLIGEQLGRDCCAHGHPYSSANTYLSKGARVCRRCKADQQARRRQRRAR